MPNNLYFDSTGAGHLDGVPVADIVGSCVRRGLIKYGKPINDKYEAFCRKQLEHDRHAKAFQKRRHEAGKKQVAAAQEEIPKENDCA
jgi:hypothetical protein